MNGRAYELEKSNDELIQLIAAKDEEINNLRDAITELIEQLNENPPNYVPAKVWNIFKRYGKNNNFKKG